MNGYAWFVGGLLPYFAVVVFVAGMAYRLRAWAKTPQPGKMTLFPAPTSMARGVLAEALFFPSLFKGDRVLWTFSWLFHATLALVALGHVRVFTGLIDRVLMGLGMSDAAIGTMSSTAGGAAGIVLLATGILLLVRRLGVQRAREVTKAGDFVALLLLLAVVATGDVMRFSGEHFDLALTRQWAWSLVTLSPVVPASAAFLTHALLGQLLLVYIPFSKVMHLGGIFFTQALVKRS